MKETFWTTPTLLLTVTVLVSNSALPASCAHNLTENSTCLVKLKCNSTGRGCCYQYSGHCCRFRNSTQRNTTATEEQDCRRCESEACCPDQYCCVHSANNTLAVTNQKLLVSETTLYTILCLVIIVFFSCLGWSYYQFSKVQKKEAIERREFIMREGTIPQGVKKRRMHGRSHSVLEHARIYNKIADRQARKKHRKLADYSQRSLERELERRMGNEQQQAAPDPTTRWQRCSVDVPGCCCDFQGCRGRFFLNKLFKVSGCLWYCCLLFTYERYCLLLTKYNNQPGYFRRYCESWHSIFEMEEESE